MLSPARSLSRLLCDVMAELPNYAVLEAVMAAMAVCDEETLLLATTTLVSRRDVSGHPASIHGLLSQASANALYAHLETNMVLALCAAHPLVDAFCEVLVHCIATHRQVSRMGR